MDCSPGNAFSPVLFVVNSTAEQLSCLDKGGISSSVLPSSRSRYIVPPLYRSRYLDPPLYFLFSFKQAEKCQQGLKSLMPWPSMP